MTPEQSAAIARIRSRVDAATEEGLHYAWHVNGADLRLLLSALEEAQAVGAGWQPIETAPKGGVFIVAYPDGRGGWSVAMAYRAKNETIRSETGATDLTDKAKFWWPLPAPPVLTPTGGQE